MEDDRERCIEAGMDDFLTKPISFSKLQASVAKWRNVQLHRKAQAKGRGGIFANYRLRIATVSRDYTKDDRTQAPKDSVAVHG